MREDDFWKVFAETGEPLCYLLYKAMGTESGCKHLNGRKLD